MRQIRRRLRRVRPIARLKYVCKLLIINKIVVEATGVEQFRVLITRNFDSRNCYKLKRPHCPIHSTFIVRKYPRSESGKPHTVPAVSHRFAGLNWEKTLSPDFSSVRYSVRS